MPNVFFVNEDMPFQEEDFLHRYKLNKYLVAPNVGDIVDFEDDGHFYNDKFGDERPGIAEKCGTKFVVVKREIVFSRGPGYRDDCNIFCTVIRAS